MANLKKGRTYNDTDYPISNQKIYLLWNYNSINGDFHNTFSADHKSLV